MNIFKMMLHNLMTYRFISILIVLNIVVSAFVVCFSYGVYQNFNIVIDEGESSARELFIIPTKSDTKNYTSSVTTKMLIDTVKDLDEKTLKNIKVIECTAIVPTSAIERNIFDFSFRYDGNRFVQVGDELFSDSEYNSFRKIAAISPLLRNKNHTGGINLARTGDRWEAEYIGDAQTVTVGDEEFSIVNELLDEGYLAAPITAFYNDTPINCKKYGWCVCIEFTTDLSRTQYDDIVASIQNNMGDNARIPDMNITPASQLFYYKTILIVSFLISLLAALNLSVLYRFILSKRIKMLTIFRLCGCTKGKIIRMYIGECMLVSLPLFALSEFCFDKLLLPILSGVFEYIEFAYSPLLYLAIFGIYTGACFIVLFIMISAYVGRHTIAQLKAGDV